MHSLRRARAPAFFLLCACAEKPGASLVVETEAIDFGVVEVGASATTTLAVRNAGEATVDLHSVALVAGDPEVWGVDTQVTGLFPGAGAPLTVTFTPLRAGPAAGAIEIRSDDPAGPRVRVALRGEGRAPPDSGLPNLDTASPDTGLSDTGAPDTGAPCGDADGDGHDTCDAGGDCDDTDPAAFPVLVAPGAGSPGDGTEAAPFPTLSDALAALDARCREVVLLPGAHAASLPWDGGPLTVRGTGAPEDTVLTAGGAGRIASVGPSGALTFDALTLTGGTTDGDGGAVRVERGAVTLRDVVVSGNTSGEDGGAVALIEGTLTLERATFDDNTAFGEGGAVYTWGGTITDDAGVWTRNRAASGGAVCVRDGELNSTDAVFEANNASGAGGAVDADDARNLTLERATITGNAAGWRGGGVSIDDVESALVRNVVTQGNSAGEEGGAIAVSGGSSIVIANNTLVADRAGGEGGALWVGDDPAHDTHVWSNVIAYAGGESGLWVADTSAASVAYTLGWGAEGAELVLPDHVDDGGNLAADPLFVAFSDDDVANDDLAPLPASPAIDAGPVDGEGPASYRAWADPDGSRNDRGATGGPGAR